MAKKLLIHISDRDKWPIALRLVQSLVGSAPAEQFQVVIVADVFAGGVCVACHRALREQMAALVASGHQIRVCAASLQALNLRQEGLPEFMILIPNSLAEIPARLAEGYQYLKI
jgi:intracellular sulfur oxidation DsrE/DsrF family protein